MESRRDINSYFDGVLNNIDTILNDDFYENKESLLSVRKKILKWYDSYKKSKSLKKIDPNELKDLDLEITDFFARYVKIEPVKQNYTERLSFDFSELESLWKEEMLGGKVNGR